MIVTALLVMDDSDQRRQIALQLIDRGLRIAVATDADTAAIMLSENNSIILTLADFYLEKGRGFPICRTACSSSHRTYIILFGCETSADELLCFRHGADDCIRAPFHQSLLFTRIKKLILPKGVTEQGNLTVGASAPANIW